MKCISPSTILNRDDGLCAFTTGEAPLRRIRFKDPETAKTLIVLTNNFALPALTITELYRCRWQVELFFK